MWLTLTKCDLFAFLLMSALLTFTSRNSMSPPQTSPGVSLDFFTHATHRYTRCRGNLRTTLSSLHATLRALTMTPEGEFAIESDLHTILIRVRFPNTCTDGCSQSIEPIHCCPQLLEQYDWIDLQCSYKVRDLPRVPTISHTIAAPTTHDPFRFLNLPAELRVQIYEHLVVVGSVLHTRRVLCSHREQIRRREIVSHALAIDTAGLQPVSRGDRRSLRCEEHVRAADLFRLRRPFSNNREGHEYPRNARTR